MIVGACCLVVGCCAFGQEYKEAPVDDSLAGQKDAVLAGGDAKEVKDFLLQYRALYNTEPSRSAYSGYDLMKYFSTLAHKFGKKWPKALDRVDYNGLQSDFKLVRTPSGSYVNNAVRRVVYNPDYSVSILR